MAKELFAENFRNGNWCQILKKNNYSPHLNGRFYFFRNVVTPPVLSIITLIFSVIFLFLFLILKNFPKEPENNNIPEQFAAISGSFYFNFVLEIIFYASLYYFCRRKSLAVKRERWDVFFSTVDRRVILLSPLLAIALAAIISVGTTPHFGGAMSHPANPSGRVASFEWRAIFHFSLRAIIALIAAPLAEETYFRGMLLGWLRQKISMNGAIAVSAFIFTVSHLQIFQIPGLSNIVSTAGILAVGVVTGLFLSKYGSLWPAIIFHGTYNLSLLLISIM